MMPPEAITALSPAAADGAAGMPPSLSVEWTLPSAAAARLSRHEAMAALPSARCRSESIRRTWRDTADRRLAAQDVLVEERDEEEWWLIRLRPPPEAIPYPGQPLAPLRRLAPQAVPEEAEGEALIIVGAFAGRQWRWDYPMAGAEPVKVELLQGRLRALAAEREVARLRLSGPPQALLALARRLASDFPLLPAWTTLAEEATAFAQGISPRPYREDKPQLTSDRGVEEAFTQAMGHLLCVLAHQTAAITAGGSAEAVHQARVALRRLRSIVRIFRPATDCPALRRLDAAFDAVLERLSPLRDWDVFLATIAADIMAAFPAEPRLAAVMVAAARARAQALASVQAAFAEPSWRMVWLEVIELLHTRPWRGVEEAERGQIWGGRLRLSLNRC